jgi:hypothetical protein
MFGAQAEHASPDFSVPFGPLSTNLTPALCTITSAESEIRVKEVLLVASLRFFLGCVTVRMVVFLEFKVPLHLFF